MGTFITVWVSVVLILATLVWRRRGRAGASIAPRPHQRPPVRGAATPARPPTAAPSPRSDPGGNIIAGWMLGHEIARGHHGFPGDPLPGGHLGSPADLAFWGGILDDDPDDPDF